MLEIENQTLTTVFDQKTAASYDQQTELWTSGREALFSFTCLILAKLPDNARILCVGVGTGTELITLAQTFGKWQFTAVEPAPAMLDICRQKVQEAGITSRCTFHEGYLDSLPPLSEEFDAATCFLVSHYFTEAQERSNFFNQIASRLRPQGYLISSDVVLGISPSAFESLLEVWVRFRGLESTEEKMEKVRATWNRYASALSLSVPEVEAIIVAGGFDAPVLFFQTLFIYAWFSRRTVAN